MFDACLYFNLIVLTRRIQRIWQEDFARLGLSPSQGYLLVALNQHPGASQKELAFLMELDASTVTRFLDALIAKRLVVKNGHGKGSQVSLTTVGRKESRKIQRVMDGLYSRMQGHFGPRHFKRFVDQLHNARESFRD